MRNYCTLFDSGYIARGLTLVNSLNEHCSPCRIFILCMDDEVEILLGKLETLNIIPVRLADLESEDKQLYDVKANRNKVEYYFTCKSSLVRYVLAKNTEFERVTYLDADLFFFSDPSELDDEIAQSSVAVIEHRFSTGNLRLYKYGRFNAGWISVRNDVAGHNCLDWWRSRCLEWCHDFVEGDRYADQKYMDKFPELFNAAIVGNIGANLAPWNIGNYNLTYEDGNLFVDRQPVIFYHFQGVKRIYGSLIESGLASYRQQLGAVAREHLYMPYMEKWHEAERKVDKIRQGLTNQAGIEQLGASAQKIKRGTFARRSRILLTSILRNLKYRTLFLSSGCSRRNG
jgi:lipopolysaccharide biosynthesis glycosyltransferase